ncbi:MAG: hypothetical protein CR993_06125 [Rhodobacterales bacterium]|nr:MAG: hypothetical protein CR993_06125 [Rhodobacterales bacterium]
MCKTDHLTSILPAINAARIDATQLADQVFRLKIKQRRASFELRTNNIGRAAIIRVRILKCRTHKLARKRVHLERNLIGDKTTLRATHRKHMHRLQLTTAKLADNMSVFMTPRTRLLETRQTHIKTLL